MTEVWGIPVAGLTAPALLGIAILLILRGSLIPRRTYDDVMKDRDKWYEAHRISEEVRISQSKQLDELLSVGNTVNDVLIALRQLAQENQDGP